MAIIAVLANAGTLAAFARVSFCMLIMHRRAPDVLHIFRTQRPWLVGSVRVLECVYLFYGLPVRTLIGFFDLDVVGRSIYFLYAR